MPLTFALVIVAATSSVTSLAPGQVVEREAAVGETHRYSITLRAGDYLQLLVEQRRADVSEVLTAPDGALVLETDNVCGVIGPDAMAVIAPAAGVYELDVKVLDAEPQGRYELRVEAVREPTVTDRLRVEAVRATADGLRLAADDPEAAVRRFRESAARWGAVGERRLQMWMDEGAGALLGDGLGRMEEARQVIARALATALPITDNR